LTSTSLQSKNSTGKRKDLCLDSQRRAFHLSTRLRKDVKTKKESTPKYPTKNELPADDPIRGQPTAFVESFRDPYNALPTKQRPYKYSVTQDLLSEQLAKSKELARLVASLNYAPTEQQFMKGEEPVAIELEKLDNMHVKASEAVRRILTMEHSNSRDRSRVNITRCVDTFGRHQTDSALPDNDGGPRKTKERAGPDTGSSEVQIAILTAKIKRLADMLRYTGHKDKTNKRNLRLLVHRRQKLLQYLRRRERGGPRWQHCIETLGLTEATWKGEITV
jgi:ribosomal protein S15